MSEVIVRAARDEYRSDEYTLASVLAARRRFERDVREDLQLPDAPWVTRAFRLAEKRCAGLDTLTGAIQQWLFLKDFEEVFLAGGGE